MEFNLALNTIVYIMFFIFPGLIFRKSLFIKHDVRQFDRGNLFERFSLTLLNSVLLLIITFFLFFFLTKVLEIKLLDSLSYETFKEIFENLQKNTLPELEDVQTQFPNYLELFSYIYLMSAFAGFSFHKITNYKVVKSWGLFRKSNYWHDLVIKNFSHDEGNKKHKHLRTFADILVVVNDKTKLYSGTVVDYYLNAEDSSLQTIVLKDVSRYEKKSKNKSKKKVPGNLFVIDNKNIANINLTYLYSSKPDHTVVSNIMRVLFLSGVFFIISAPFLDFMQAYIPSMLRKTLFVISGGYFWMATTIIIKDFIIRKWKTSWVYVGIMFTFLLILLAALGVFHWVVTLMILLFLLIIIGVVKSWKQNRSH